MMLRSAFAAMALVALVAAVLLAGPPVVAVLAPDHTTPASVARILTEARRTLSAQLDLPASAIRYVGIETRDRDELVVLQFEIRSFPFLAIERAYLFSRCTPLDDLDPAGMGGGRGVTDFATDPELEHLRSDAQPPCS